MIQGKVDSVVPVYRIDRSQLNLVFLRMYLNPAQVAAGIGLDSEIDSSSAAIALLLGFRLIVGQFNPALVLVAAMRAFNRLPDNHEPSTYSSSGSACNPPRSVCAL